MPHDNIFIRLITYAYAGDHKKALLHTKICREYKKVCPKFDKYTYVIPAPKQKLVSPSSVNFRTRLLEVYEVKQQIGFFLSDGLGLSTLVRLMQKIQHYRLQPHVF